MPRGAGTGLSGGANAIDGSVIIGFERMNAIASIDPVERLAVVQPGVVNDDLRAAVADHGLWYPPDPASSPWSTIGGNVATNAGGVCCVKYGVTRDYVLGLEVVTGTGELVRLGRRTAKGVAGYDLAGLLVGSEGTLGLITEITVRLRPAQAPSTRWWGSSTPWSPPARRWPRLRGPVSCRRRWSCWTGTVWRRSTTGSTSVSTPTPRHPAGAVDAPGAAGRARPTGAGLLRGQRRDLGGPVDRPGRGRRAVRRPTARLPGRGTAGPVLTEDVCVPTPGAGDARPDRGDR